MASTRLRKISHTIFLITSLSIDTKESLPTATVDPLLEACHLYFLFPFESTHYMTIQISIVPFSMPEYAGQIFYYAIPSYSKCCLKAIDEESLYKVTDIAQESYCLYVRHHHWNLQMFHTWQPLGSNRLSLPENESCFEKSLHLLKCLINDPSATYELEISLCRPPTIALSRSWLEQNSLSESPKSIVDPGLPSIHGGSHEISAHFTQGDFDEYSGTNTQAVMKVAQHFLRNIAATKSSRLSDDLHANLLMTDLTNRESFEPAKNALKAFKLVALQAKEQIKHASYTRFVSLCFFLIWESFVCKGGKAGARETNAKMREAGFHGSSRSLKALRDETVLVNSIVASIEVTYGKEAALSTFYRIFESSNYHLIRLMNRFGARKKVLAMEKIRQSLDALKFLQTDSYPMLRVHDIIRGYMPKISEEQINVAIGYVYKTDAASFSNEDLVQLGTGRTFGCVEAGIDPYHQLDSFDGTLSDTISSPFGRSLCSVPEFGNDIVQNPPEQTLLLFNDIREVATQFDGPNLTSESSLDGLYSLGFN